MADPEHCVDDNDEPEETPGYIPPAQKSLKEIQELDQDDESLQKYKQTLLGDAQSQDDGGPNVVVEKLSVIVEGRPDIEIDLTGDISKLKEKPLILKEGVDYRLKITFKVKREIVAGLRFFNVTKRKGIQVDKQSYMVGSYGPKAESQTFLCPPEETPSGMISRGSYTVKSKFIDDDKKIYLEWNWSFDIKKDWQ